MAVNRLSEFRRAAGLTQRALADKAGVSQAAISAIECGLKTPTVDRAFRIAGALGRRPEEIWPPEPATTPDESESAGVRVAGRAEPA